MSAFEQAAAAIQPHVARIANQIVQSGAGFDGRDATAIAGQVTKELSAVVVNQANAEPVYQSTVTIGAAVTLITGGYGLAYAIATSGPPTPADFATMVGPIVGAAIVIWGRWFQKKPLGS